MFCPFAPAGHVKHVSCQGFECFVQHSLVLSLGWVVQSLGFVVLSLGCLVLQCNCSPDPLRAMRCIESTFHL